jgi:uncharacterized membrane protein YqiK
MTLGKYRLYFLAGVVVLLLLAIVIWWSSQSREKIGFCASRGST